MKAQAFIASSRRGPHWGRFGGCAARAKVRAELHRGRSSVRCRVCEASHCLPLSAMVCFCFRRVPVPRARHDTSHVQNLARVRVTAHFSCRVIAASCTCSTRSCALAGARSPRHVCSIAHRHDVQFQQMPRLALSRRRALGDDGPRAVISSATQRSRAHSPVDRRDRVIVARHTLRGENCARAAFAPVHHDSYNLARSRQQGSGARSATSDARGDIHCDVPFNSAGYRRAIVAAGFAASAVRRFPPKLRDRNRDRSLLRR